MGSGFPEDTDAEIAQSEARSASTIGTPSSHVIIAEERRAHPRDKSGQAYTYKEFIEYAVLTCNMPQSYGDKLWHEAAPRSVEHSSSHWSAHWQSMDRTVPEENSKGIGGYPWQESEAGSTS